MNQTNSKTLETLLSAKKIDTDENNDSTNLSKLLHVNNSTLQTALSRLVDLPTFRQNTGSLSSSERLQIIDQALVLLEENYVHLKLKESMHAIEPIQKLKLLDHQIRNTPEDELTSDLDFHRQMSRIFNSIRDLHTNYLLPSPYNSFAAFVPFEVEAFYENGQRKYLVSRLVAGFKPDFFKPGVEVIYWNGIPIERAVELNAERFAGSNPDAQRARGIAALTIRPLIIALPPDEDWVVVGYKTSDGQEKELKVQWLVTDEGIRFENNISAGSLTVEATAQGIDIGLDRLSQTKKLLFAPDVIDAENKLAQMKKPLSQMTTAFDEMNLGLDSILPGVLQARRVKTNSGTFGYLRIRTFSVENAEDFVNEVIRLVEQLPQNGLIIDVRGNGGGLITAGEQLLQIFTPREIEPEKTQFINTPLNLELCERHAPSELDPNFDLSPWVDSIKQSVQTAAIYSKGFPITSPIAANAIGQKYHGPVVLITDALCYSTTDIFAAGFQDHEIGKILGIDNNTGAGGANVWTHDLLKLLFNAPSPAENSPYTDLPQDVGMRVSIRRTLRVGKQAGTPVEDLGVVPDFLHNMTKQDLLNQNTDLINRAAEILQQMEVRQLEAAIKHVTNRGVKLLLHTRGINRLDVFVNQRPQGSLDFTDGETELDIPLCGIKSIGLKGYDENLLVASRRLTV